MAASYKIVMNFADADGKAVTMTFQKAQSKPDASKVIAAMDTIIANGSIYKNVPASKKSAYVVATEQTDIDLSA